jgi:hypothetical protein
LSVAALLAPPPAAAGGWWTSIRVDREQVAVGQEVRAHANVMFSSVDAVEAAQSGRVDEQFYVYLLRGFDYSIVKRAMRADPGDWWTLGDAEAYRVARVVIGSGDANLALANAAFRVPELPSGRYSVMFCSAGCARPLADVIPTLPSQLMISPRPTPNRTSPWVHAAWLLVGMALGAVLALTLRGRRSVSPTSRYTAVRVVRPSSSSRGGRSPAPRRRSGGRSSPRA